MSDDSERLNQLRIEHHDLYCEPKNALACVVEQEKRIMELEDMIHRDKIIEGHIRARWTELEEENLKLHTELDEANARAGDVRLAAAAQYLKDQKRIVELERRIGTLERTIERQRSLIERLYRRYRKWKLRAKDQGWTK